MADRVAGAAAAVVGAVVLFGLAAGAGRAGLPDRAADPALYWSWIGLGAACAAGLAAQARGWTAARPGGAEGEAARARRLRLGALAALAVCALMAGLWWGARPAPGAADPGHSLRGLWVLVLAGFVLALAPTGPALRAAGAVLTAAAFAGAWLL